jgi:hypothetical protein
VMSLYDGTSFRSFSYVALSKSTWLFNLSRTFPFDHFCKYIVWKLTNTTNYFNLWATLLFLCRYHQSH